MTTLRPGFLCLKMHFYLFNLIFLLSLMLLNTDASEIFRPRGVSISKASLYIPEKEFTCFDGSRTIPFMQVNDDYCDCTDGSDEPGTPACPNGTFHCTNAGHRPLNIPSSRVNDGICDCCDASDEYHSHARCINNCNELGKAARIEAQKIAELNKIGNEMRLQLSKKGKQLKQEKQERLLQLEKDREEAESLKNEKETLKLASEQLENQALEKYRKIEEEEKLLQQEEERKVNEQEAFEHFHRLDSNQDGKLEIAELQTQQTFDQNGDGAVTEEEARFFLDNHDDISWEEFVESGWARMKPLIMLDKGMFHPPSQEAAEDTEAHEHEEEEVDKDADIDDRAYEDEGEGHEADEEEEEELEEEEGLAENNEQQTEEKPKYDDETQRLIDEAGKARAEFEEADRSSRDVQREMNQIKELLDKDYGRDEEFAPLNGECFEYTDIEYTYKLCPFDQVSQRSKSGGSETRLGTWSNWIGSDTNKYQAMLYDKGQSCWNGPQRSTQVNMRCGTDNAITSVSEPNRCEYMLDFATPSFCQSVENVEQQGHDEL